MPRLSQNPEMLRAARLAKVGPETWQSWKDAGMVALDIFKAMASNSVAGDLLRASGVEMPSKQGDKQTLQDYIVDSATPIGGIFAGSKALKANKSMLKKAKMMWRTKPKGMGGSLPETGWFKGAAMGDDLPRFEIDDSKAGFRPHALSNMKELLKARKRFTRVVKNLQTKYKGQLNNPGSLDELLDKVSPIEYTNYYIAQAKVDDMKSALTGSYPVEGTRSKILAEDVYRHPELYENYPSAAKIEIFPTPESGGAYSNEMRGMDVGMGEYSDPGNTLIHELQHHVQYQEGFPKGGSPDEFAPSAEAITSLEDKILKLHHEIQNTPNMDTLANRDRLNRLKAIYDEYEEQGATAYDKYRNLSGEFEARQAAERRHMSAKERKATLPWMGQSPALTIKD